MGWMSYITFFNSVPSVQDTMHNAKFVNGELRVFCVGEIHASQLSKDKLSNDKSGYYEIK